MTTRKDCLSPKFSDVSTSNAHPHLFFFYLYLLFCDRNLSKHCLFSQIKKPMSLENKLSLAKEANEILLSTHKFNLKEHTILWDNKT